MLLLHISADENRVTDEGVLIDRSNFETDEEFQKDFDSGFS